MEKPAILGGKPVREKPLPFVSIIFDDDEIQSSLIALKDRALASGVFIEKFEKEFANFIGTKYAVSVSNGTDGLFLAYLVLGLTFNKHVVTTPITFIATASTIVHTGAIPIFADVDFDGNISPESVAKVVKSGEVDGLSLVHLYGKPVEMDPILEIAEEYQIPIIEDASHAHGAEYKGKKVGSIGDIGVFSLYPTKVIAAGGWGGVITTNNREIYEKLLYLRAHGEERVKLGKAGAYTYIRLGYNLRMSNIEAAVAYHQLKKINKFIEARQKNAKLLTDLLSDVDGLILPTYPAYMKHIFYIYNVLIDENKIGWTRDKFVEALNAEGIPAERGYHTPLHKQPLFQRINDPNVNHFARIIKYPDYGKVKLPKAEEVAKRTIWLPVHPGLNEEDIESIAKAIVKLIEWKKGKS